MPLVAANGQNAFDSQLCTPRQGAWHFDMRVDDPTLLSGQITISLSEGLRTLLGTPIRSGEFVDTAQLRVLAGAGAFGMSAVPKFYNGASIGLILRDLLGGVGEKLSPTADAGTLATALGSWTTAALPVGAVVAMLFASAAPASGWRFLDDGTFWCGPETWPDAGVDVDTYQVLDRSDEDGWVKIAVATPLALVGKTFEGGKVSYTQADVPHVAGVTMRVWFEDATPSALGRARDAFAALVRGTPVTIDHRAEYPGTVVAQGTGTVDVRPDDARLDSMQGIPLWSQAGDAVDQVVGGRVKIGWHGGDPSQPYAGGFDGSATPTTRTLSVLQSLNLGGAGALPALTAPHQQAEAALMSALSIAFGELASACATPPLTPLESAFGNIVSALATFQQAAVAANNFLSTKVNVLP